jgi:glyoxylase-like metal-dependent hydrolase (beta-lactamase superfamily II)
MSLSPALQFPLSDAPAPGTTVEVAPGVHWLRMPLPFALDHINLWLLEDAEGWCAIDSGIGDDATRALWDNIAATRFGVRPLARVITTHCHPDHAGNAAWLAQRFGAQFWITQTEYLAAHALHDGSAGYTAEAVLELFRGHGLGSAMLDKMARRGNQYRVLVPEVPLASRRMMDGERVAIGRRHWRVLAGYGHSPEHASLYCEELKLLVSGDMLLPRISTNVSVSPIDPLGNPLQLFLESIRRYRTLPSDVLVLPSHGLPFRGAHVRVAELEAHHEARLAELLEACSGKARSAAELLETMFRRPLDAHQIFFAMGEAIAHLHYLERTGRALRQTGADGVTRFAARAEAARATG